MTAVVSPAKRETRGHKSRPGVIIIFSGVVVLIVAAFALLGVHIAPADPDAQNLLLGAQGPSAAHWFGTDSAGRDILSRVIVGARHAMIGPLLIAGLSAVIASALGLLAGYRGGWVDSFVMRTADLLYAFPALLVVIVLVGVIGGGYFAAVLILVLLTWPGDARVLRGATLEQRTLPYVDAAKTLGLGRTAIIVRHVWPNVLPLVVTNMFLDFAYAIVALSSLAYLGLGVAPGSPDWGLMISENFSLLGVNPLAVLAPGIALVLLAASMNVLGDYAYERLSDRGRAR